MIEVLRIDNYIEAIFIQRINKYLAEVKIGDCIELVHVHDPGRLTELLYKGNIVFIKKAENPNRKTGWDVIAAKKEGREILINSAYHRKISESVLSKKEISPLGAIAGFKAEVKFKESRIDFLISDLNGNEIWMETKGCTLSENGVAMFPDAPTVRGKRHLNDLIELKFKGKGAVVFILVLAPAEIFKPNYITDPEFANTFYHALDAGVEIYPLRFNLIKGSIYFEKIIPIEQKSNSLLD